MRKAGGEKNMTQALTTVTSSSNLPALFTPDPDAAKRFLEFFTAHIRK